MDTLAIFAIILAIVGIVGGVLPVIPGPPVSFAALLCLFFSDAPKGQITVTALIIWGTVALALTIIDYIIPGYITKLSGGHKAAARGATIGLFAGIIFTPIGMIAGSFLGALIGELVFEKQDLAHSLKAAAGSFLGFILSSGMKVVFSTIVLISIVKSLI